MTSSKIVGLSARDERRGRILSILSDLREIASEKQPLEQQEKELRNELSLLIAEEENRYHVPGVARIENTAPSMVATYDKSRLDGLARELTLAGNGDLAQRILACRKSTMRAGSLRIMPDKEQV